MLAASAAKSRVNTYFSGKDPVSYPLIFFFSLFNGLATPPVLQWHTNLTFEKTIIKKIDLPKEMLPC